ncbi:DsrE family protein [Reinekea thalattae]|uniref:Uncharacterized protein n=1 Tax=Reinekea thalattae TaxID=2593301 RepID=A0A5C8Z9D1_9GAMM|nr:DsrE family protein [Reinekea thalattae]TXR53470.1 hypothetical protein FME95_02560 [Reinekea thalattae]
MAFNLFVVKKPSYLGRSHLEILEALMSIGLFDIEHKIVFFEAGVSWLLKEQAPINEKSIEKQINALPMYGAENLYYVDSHAQALYPNQALNENAEAVSTAELASWMQQAEHVEVFG